MSPAVRKTIAIGSGIFTFLMLIIFAFLSSFFLGDLADFLTNNTTKKLFGTWSYDTPQISNFYLFYEIAICLAIGLTITYIIWDFKDKFRRRLFIYIPFMIIIVGFTSYNYTHADMLIRPDIQVIFNLVLIFFALVCLVQLWNLKTHSNDGQIIKYFIFFLLFLFGFFLPMFFSTCWLIKRLGISKLTFNFNMPIITTISGTITTIITVLKYKDDKKKVNVK